MATALFALLRHLILKTVNKATECNPIHMDKITSRFLFLAILFILAACSGAGIEGPATPTSPPATITAVAPAAPTATITPFATTTMKTAPSATASPSAPTVTTIAPTPAAVTTTAPTPPPGPLNGAALVEALRGGGYVIYFRHAATDPTPDDSNPVVLEDCTTQRNLSTAGQAQAREIGQAFQQLDIPVGQVLSSPFCRALDTVRLAFGKAEAEAVLENLETSANETERETRINGLRRLLAAPPDPGTNTILAGHGFNINAAAQISIAEGEAAIFRPDGAGGFTLVATVPWNEWETLK